MNNITVADIATAHLYSVHINSFIHSFRWIYDTSDEGLIFEQIQTHITQLYACS